MRSHVISNARLRTQGEGFHYAFVLAAEGVPEKPIGATLPAQAEGGIHAKPEKHHPANRIAFAKGWLDV